MKCLLLIIAAETIAHAAEPIVGGIPTDPGEFPTVVEIHTSYFAPSSHPMFSCTGTLIASDWVLTAAHCISTSTTGAPDQATITAGTVIAIDGLTIAAADTIPDPDYPVLRFGVYDVGLIKLATPVSSHVPLALNFDAANAPLGISAITVGYGVSHLDSEYQLAHTTTACPAKYDPALVACFPQGMVGIGVGDSGGPSFALIDDRLVQFGVTSFTEPPIAGVARVDSVAAFILAHVPELDCAQAGCPSGLTCQQHTCLAPACSEDRDCAYGETCFHAACMASPGIGAACRSGDDCASGDCFSGACTLPCAIGNDAACPANFACTATDAYSDTQLGHCASTDGGGCAVGGGMGAWSLVALALFVARMGAKSKRTLARVDGVRGRRR